MSFEYATAGKIIFGPGSIKELGRAAASYGNKALLILGGSKTRAAPWIEQLKSGGMQVWEFHVRSEPTVDLVNEGLQQANAISCNVVISIGGGSVIDAGKAIAILMTNPGSVEDYLEVVGKGKALVAESAPFIAVPTTAGTGSEVTRNAVLGVLQKRVKVSLRAYQMLPKLAIVDPELTYSMPPEITATSGMDALTQLIEPFLSVGSNAMTDAVCRAGIERARRSLKTAFENGADRQARMDMSLAALFGGMALANAKLGAVHGLAGPIGGMYAGAPHGAVCARLLPIVVQANLRALLARTGNSPVLDRFRELGTILTGFPTASAEDGIDWLYRLREDLKIAPLASYGARREDAPGIIAAAQRASSMKGNPIVLSDQEVGGILESGL